MTKSVRTYRVKRRHGEAEWDSDRCVLLTCVCIFSTRAHALVCPHRIYSQWPCNEVISSHMTLGEQCVLHSKIAFCMNNVSFTAEILSLWLHGHVPLVSHSSQRINLCNVVGWNTLPFLLRQKRCHINIKCLKWSRLISYLCLRKSLSKCSWARHLTTAVHEYLVHWPCKMHHQHQWEQALQPESHISTLSTQSLSFGGLKYFWACNLTMYINVTLNSRTRYCRMLVLTFGLRNKYPESY